MGRFWQTRLLMKVNPIFEYVPIEETVKANQESYYQSLADADGSGKSTVFIEFVLESINQSLRKTIDDSSPGRADYAKRADVALGMLNDGFDRKAYMKVIKEYQA